MKLDLAAFRPINVQRATEGFKCYDNQPLTYWTTALAGEVGELCNMIKKMQRVERGGVDGGSSYTAKDINKEMHDHYGDIKKVPGTTLKGLIYYLKVPNDKAGQENRFRDILAKK